MQSYPNDTLLDASLEIVSGDYRRRLPSNEHSVENIPPINENETFQVRLSLRPSVLTLYIDDPHRLLA